MSTPANESKEDSSEDKTVSNGKSGVSGDSVVTNSENARPLLKRPIPASVIEISDTDSDDSDICAVTTYRATVDEVKRIRKDYYSSGSSSSSSSSSSYTSDSDSGCEDDSYVVDGGDTCGVRGRGALMLRADRGDEPLLNPHLKEDDVIDKVTTHWKEFQKFSSSDVTLTNDPFRICQLHNLLENSEYINNIVDDMNTLDWSRKKMDLYEFHQTVDLANLTWQRSIRGIYQLLKCDVMSWVSKVTGLELCEVSASCSLYGPGDHLLVHDDLLGDRRIAFILYLAPWTPRPHKTMENGQVDHIDDQQNWSPWLGGALQLLSRDDNGQPLKIVHNILPANNMLAFFQVGVDSFHQVEEVCSMELPRLSINGWFHGPAPPDPSPTPSPSPSPASAPAPDPAPATLELPPLIKTHTDVVLINSWISSAYMPPRSRAQIQTQMESASEVSLFQFLQEHQYDTLLQALCSPDIPWEQVGPANQQHYSRLPTTWLESQPIDNSIKAFIQLITSNTWIKFLSDCTDLVCTGYRQLEFQRWEPSNYTLLPPRDHYQEAKLDAVFCLGVPEHPFCGGSMIYTAPEDSASGSLVNVPPVNNALALVYCDIGAARFTKYLSKITMEASEQYYVLTCSYVE